MSGIMMSWAAPAVQAIAWALIHFLWQGALVGLAAVGALSLLKRGSANRRYAVAAGALLLMLALPGRTALRMAGSAAETTAAVAGPPGPAGSVGVALASTRAGASSAPTWTASLPSALPWIFAVWLAGVALLSVYHLGGWRQTRKLTRTGRPLSEELEATVRALASRLGVARAVRLLESAAVPVPAVIGWLRPAILVPASTLAGLTPRQLEAILAHELAHVRRHDYLINLLQTVVETLLFYHPAVWWVSSQVRRERENCCDDLAVAVCGDRLGYARALADLEGLRSSPRLAVAADGGSLLDRIRRLVGAPARRSPRPWMAGVLALSLLPVGLTFNIARGAADRDDDTGSYSNEVSDTETGDTADRADGRRGTWSVERRGKEIQLEMTMSWRGGRHRWSHGTTTAASDFPGFTAGPDVRFDLRRDAGTFHFEGRFKGDEGNGFFTFTGNPGYIKDMAALGIQVKEDRLLEAATQDLSLAFAREIHDLGYRDASFDDLVQFRIHGVNPQIIRELSALGYQHLPADEIVQFQIHGVSPALLRELGRAGYKGIPPDQVVQLKIHGVSPEYVRALADNGYRDVPADDLVQFRIHGISPEFLRGLAEAGYRNVSADQLVQLRIHGVDGRFARDAVSRYGKLAPDQLVQLKIRGRLD